MFADQSVALDRAVIRDQICAQMAGKGSFWIPVNWPSHLPLSWTLRRSSRRFRYRLTNRRISRILMLWLG